MEESPRDNEPVYGPVVPPPDPSQNWQQMNGYNALQAHALVAGGYQGEWHDYQYSEKIAYPEQYLKQDMQTYDAQGGDPSILQGPQFITQEEKQLWMHNLDFLNDPAGWIRDVGLNQITVFEGEVDSGNGKQVLSRDVQNRPAT